MVVAVSAAAEAAFGGQVRNAAVLQAMRRVAREEFLDSSMRAHAKSDSPLPIGFSQTTSSPFVIARMLEMLFAGRKPAAGAPPFKVLEVGSGCGYQTALLAELGCEVHGVERIAALAKTAAAHLRRLRYANADVRHADGLLGWQEAAPYDGIVLCAEHDSLPPALLAQLCETGRLVMPLRQGGQIFLVSANAAGKIVSRRERVEFVPMLRGTE